MKSSKNIFVVALALLLGLTLSVETSLASSNENNTDTASLNAGAKTIPAGHKGRISLNDLELEFSKQLAIDKIEVVTVGNGQKKNHESFTHIEAFNDKAASIAKKVARAGDELHITMYLPDGKSNRYAIKLSR